MKPKIIIPLACMAVLILLTSCHKEGIETFRGSYTYKISGTLTLAAPAEAGGDTQTRALVPEQGQMNIAVKDKAANKVIVSWNDIMGNVSTSDASIQGSRISLAGGDKTVQLSSDGSHPLGGSGFIKFGGEGDQYDNMLIIHMKYDGEITLDGTPMTIIDSDIQCVAKAN